MFVFNELKHEGTTMIASAKFLALWRLPVEGCGFRAEMLESFLADEWGGGEGCGRWRIFGDDGTSAGVTFRNAKNLGRPDLAVINIPHKHSWQPNKLCKQREILRCIENIFLGSGCLICGYPVGCRALYSVSGDNFDEWWAEAIDSLGKADFGFRSGQVDPRRHLQTSDKISRFIISSPKFATYPSVLELEYGPAVDVATELPRQYISLDYAADARLGLGKLEIEQVLLELGAAKIFYNI